MQLRDRRVFNFNPAWDWYVFVVVYAQYLAAVSRLNRIHGVVPAITLL